MTIFQFNKCISVSSGLVSVLRKFMLWDLKCAPMMGLTDFIELKKKKIQVPKPVSLQLLVTVTSDSK